MARFNPLKPNAKAPAPRPEKLAKGTIPTPSPVSAAPVLTENDSKDGFEIRFPSKPDEALLAKFRATRELASDERWHWHFRGKYWYARRNDKTRVFAASIVGSAQKASGAGVEPGVPSGGPAVATADPSTASATLSPPEGEGEPQTNIIPVAFTAPPTPAPIPVVNQNAMQTWRNRFFRHTKPST